MPRWTWIGFCLSRSRKVSLVRATPKASPGRKAAEQALRSSEQACQEVEAVGVEVTAVSQLMRDMRARNHFAEMIRASFEGGR